MLYDNTVGVLQTWIFEQLAQPALFALGMGHLVEPAYDATEWVLLGLIEIAVLYMILRPLEARFPAEAWSNRREMGSDVVYTFLHRLGLVPVVFFLLLQPVSDRVEAWLRMRGFTPWNLEDLLPFVGASAVVSFIAYLVVLDFCEYWRHRLQHRFAWWWELHALHHSQRKMSFWTDDRNHLLDDLLHGLWLAVIAIIIGVPPGQFFLIVILTRMIESLSHANVRLSFGRIGERLLVSPAFHRRHHGIGVGHEGRHHGCNFAVLFPVWDVLFGTADHARPVEPTGIRDQLAGRDYGRGWCSQQWLALRSMIRVLSGRKPVPQSTSPA